MLAAWPQLHRETGPADVIIDVETGQAVYQACYRYGSLHRSDGPAVSSKAQGVLLEEWYSHGKLHRVDGPAIIEPDTETGLIIKEELYQDRTYHGVGAPAWFWANHQHGVREFEGWYIDGKGIGKTGRHTQNAIT